MPTATEIPGGEYETGNLTLQIVDAASVGQEFQPNTHPIAFHVVDVEATRAAGLRNPSGERYARDLPRKTAGPIRSIVA